MSYQQDPYLDEGLFTAGDVSAQDLAYGESAWAINPVPMEPIRQPFRAQGFSGNYVIVDQHAIQGNYGYNTGNYGYYNLPAAPRFLDYAALDGLGIDFESEKGKALMRICAHHANTGEGSIAANIKAARLVEEWLTPSELAQLKADQKVMIRSKKHKKRTYIIHENPSTRVEIWEGERRKALACGVVAESGFVQGDKFLTKVIAIKTDEDDYIARSSVSPG